MKDGIVCIAECGRTDCPYKSRGESPKDAAQVNLKYTTMCKEEA